MWGQPIQFRLLVFIFLIAFILFMIDTIKNFIKKVKADEQRRKELLILQNTLHTKTIEELRLIIIKYLL